MKRWNVIGNVSAIESDGLITVRDVYDNAQPPTLLKAGGRIFAYLQELGNGDSEEKYMRKRFTYCSICWVRKLEILNDGKVVKTITDDILGE